MKLIDVLAQELPKKLGWPYGAIQITQDEEGELCCWQKSGAVCIEGYWKHPDGNGLSLYMCNEDSTRLADDRGFSIVTREQYEAALAASQQPEWNEGELPPIGIKCLTIGPHGDESWYECKIIAHTVFSGRQVAVFQYGDTISHSSEKWFKPLPTKAESHREAAVKKISEIGFYLYDEDLTSAGVLYDAIASGKIPGVKLEADHE